LANGQYVMKAELVSRAFNESHQINTAKIGHVFLREKVTDTSLGMTTWVSQDASLPVASPKLAGPVSCRVMHFVITKHSDGDDQDLDALPVDAINDPSLPGANTLASYPPPIKRFTRPARLGMDDARFDDSKNCRRFYAPEADQNAFRGEVIQNRPYELF